ncbi:monofunctional biosynthetic peptidoglycan transglycosylase [Microbacter margulisiae]|uniref:Biosynthetic peptidoglycan transglycosylase n=1 Tax=Microbacter margulisiae TaxID=1350067 RepID=A0A7W5H1J5_9PORP|nr:monofunctional biosynthetic peptidoglycan transglycosylase [Microbacter margulisiae]MBB3186437.1 monofunctional biosynthetic peptidoglycan transglycosylase [Microbacter margulisiae]
MKKFGRVIGIILLAGFMFSLLSVIVYRFVPVFITPLMIVRSADKIIHGQKPVIEKKWEPLDKISPNMVQAVIASEDNLFMEHFGFDEKAIEEAFKHNEHSRRIRGGSTISQQTAKNVFLLPDRSYVRKAIEAYFTLLIETCWGKEHIMEVYLNVIETGDGIYGVEAAAEHYFHCHASQLSKSQAVLIAVSLPNPRKFNPAHPSAYLLERQAKILHLMSELPKVSFEK